MATTDRAESRQCAFYHALGQCEDGTWATYIAIVLDQDAPRRERVTEFRADTPEGLVLKMIVGGYEPGLPEEVRAMCESAPCNVRYWPRRGRKPARSATPSEKRDHG